MKINKSTELNVYRGVAAALQCLSTVLNINVAQVRARLCHWLFISLNGVQRRQFAIELEAKSARSPMTGLTLRVGDGCCCADD